MKCAYFIEFLYSIRIISMHVSVFRSLNELIGMKAFAGSLIPLIPIIASTTRTQIDHDKTIKRSYGYRSIDQ